MDFKEDQLAMEAYIRMRSNWAQDDEISDELWLEYAYEYMHQTPFPDLVIKFAWEALVYDRLTGETALWRRIPRTELYWEPGEFWWGMNYSLYASFQNFKHRPSRLLDLAIYFGLVSDSAVHGKGK